MYHRLQNVQAVTRNRHFAVHRCRRAATEIVALVVFAALQSGVAWGDELTPAGLYDAATGSLPTASGWLYGESSDSPAPVIVGDALYSGETGTYSYFERTDVPDVLDSATGIQVTFSLAVISSDFTSGGDEGTWRTGWQLDYVDPNYMGFCFGVASGGIILSSSAKRATP